MARSTHLLRGAGLALREAPLSAQVIDSLVRRLVPRTALSLFIFLDGGQKIPRCPRPRWWAMCAAGHAPEGSATGLHESCPFRRETRLPVPTSGAARWTTGQVCSS